MKLCRFALDNSLSGLEFAYGIPGTVGGAVYMNAGAYGGEMKDVLTGVSYIDDEGVLRTARQDELDLGYRHSMFSGRSFFILSAELTLAEADKSSIKEKMDDLSNKIDDNERKRSCAYFIFSLHYYYKRFHSRFQVYFDLIFKFCAFSIEHETVKITKKNP